MVEILAGTPLLPPPPPIQPPLAFRQPVVERIALAAGAVAFYEAAFDGTVEPAGQGAGVRLREVGGPFVEDVAARQHQTGLGIGVPRAISVLLQKSPMSAKSKRRIL